MTLVGDLHCDLLSYLAHDDKRGVHADESRCSLSQLKKGNVILQTLAVFTETGKRAVASAEKQFTIFRTLPQIHPDGFERLTELKFPELQKIKRQKVHIVAAIENASGLCNETETLENCFSRLDQYINMAGPLVYVSLTWNHENRFGGGNYTKVGLKKEGELLLEYLEGKQIAIDLSHTSDALACDILNHIDKKKLNLIPIASHSNFRAISNQPRNLPDEIAKEVLKRGGVVGLNFFKRFIGKNYPDDFMRQVDYARSLGALNHYCFGADFFYDADLPTSLYPFPFYYEPFSNAGCYPDLVAYLSQVFTKQELEKISHHNLADFFERLTQGQT